MAAKKKVSSAKTATKPSSNTKFAPPKGYTVADVSGGSSYAPMHDFEEDPILEGKVLEVHDVETGKGKLKKMTQVMTLETDEGNRAICQSKALEGLFEDPPIGKNIYIQFLGIIDIPGRKNGMKNFAVAIADKK